MQKPEAERQRALDMSSALNDAYRTLRDPIKRAQYLLSLEGFDIGEQRSKDVPPELLEEVFELNMALEEMRGGDDSARPQLEQAREEFHGHAGRDRRSSSQLCSTNYDAAPIARRARRNPQCLEPPQVHPEPGLRANVETSHQSQFQP